MPASEDMTTPAMHATLRAAKKELRKRIKATLKGVSADSYALQSSAATESLLSLPEYQAAKSIAIYLSMPSGEIHTSKIVRDAFAKRKQVYVPYLHSLETPNARGRKSIMEMLALNSIADYESLRPDAWGIPSLDKESVPQRQNCLGGYGVLSEQEAHASTSPQRDESTPATGLDMIIVPGMAFDTGLRRLGHGAGYYDDFLTRYLNDMGVLNDRNSLGPAKRPYLAALALKEQVFEEEGVIPTEEHDYLVDAIFVGDGSVVKSE
ncbi:hypothetical protein KEM55_004367, partial [Ascosphaera atra]